MFKDKMCKMTVAPSDGLGTTLNDVVYFVIYVIVYRIRPLKLCSTYWLKIAYFSTPLAFGAPAPYVPFGILR